MSSVDVETAKRDRWTFSETGGIPPQNFVEPKLVKWKSFDDKEISGWLYAPKIKPASGKYPVVINIHGGPEAQSRPGFLRRTSYWINELGTVVIYPQRARFNRIRQDVFTTRQRISAREHLQGHRRAA